MSIKEKRENMPLNEKVLLTTEELALSFNIGRNTAREFGERVGALRKVGRKCVFDRNIIMAAYEAGEPLYKSEADREGVKA